MDRTTFSLEIFGDRMAAANYASAGTNEKQIEFLKQQLRRAMNTELTESQRAVVTDFYFGGRTVTEIAAERGVNKSTVSRQLKRSREKLRTVLRYGFSPLWDDLS